VVRWLATPHVEDFEGELDISERTKLIIERPCRVIERTSFPQCHIGRYDEDGILFEPSIVEGLQMRMRVFAQEAKHVRSKRLTAERFEQIRFRNLCLIGHSNILKNQSLDLCWELHEIKGFVGSNGHDAVVFAGERLNLLSMKVHTFDEAGSSNLADYGWVALRRPAQDGLL
jgi:hypothetical protein